MTPISPPIEIDLVKMLWAVGLMAISICLAFWQKLGIAGSLAIATVRSVVQLAVVGYLLDAVFDLKQPVAVAGVIGLMSLVAAREAKNRIGKKVAFALPIVFGSILVGTVLILAYITLIVVQPDDSHSPRYLIPISGMVLGNAMNGVSIAAERLTSSITNKANEIETHLCLGATPQQSIDAYRTEAIKAAMIPSINTMMVVGVVTLPGMMTGQILGGVSPLLAVRYQLVILFAITAANLISTLLVTQALSRQFFTPAQQLNT